MKSACRRGVKIACRSGVAKAGRLADGRKSAAPSPLDFPHLSVQTAPRRISLGLRHLISCSAPRGAVWTLRWGKSSLERPILRRRLDAALCRHPRAAKAFAALGCSARPSPPGTSCPPGDRAAGSAFGRRLFSAGRFGHPQAGAVTRVA